MEDKYYLYNGSLFSTAQLKEKYGDAYENAIVKHGFEEAFQYNDNVFSASQLQEKYGDDYLNVASEKGIQYYGGGDIVKKKEDTQEVSSEPATTSVEEESEYASLSREERRKGRQDAYQPERHEAFPMVRDVTTPESEEYVPESDTDEQFSFDREESIVTDPEEHEKEKLNEQARMYLEHKYASLDGPLKAIDSKEFKEDVDAIVGKDLPFDKKMGYYQYFSRIVQEKKDNFGIDQKATLNDLEDELRESIGSKTFMELRRNINDPQWNKDADNAYHDYLGYNFDQDHTVFSEQFVRDQIRKGNWESGGAFKKGEGLVGNLLNIYKDDEAIYQAYLNGDVSIKNPLTDPKYKPLVDKWMNDSKEENVIQMEENALNEYLKVTPSTRDEMTDEAKTPRALQSMYSDQSDLMMKTVMNPTERKIAHMRKLYYAEEDEVKKEALLDAINRGLGYNAKMMYDPETLEPINASEATEEQIKWNTDRSKYIKEYSGQGKEDLQSLRSRLIFELEHYKNQAAKYSESIDADKAWYDVEGGMMAFMPDILRAVTKREATGDLPLEGRSKLSDKIKDTYNKLIGVNHALELNVDPSSIQRTGFWLSMGEGFSEVTIGETETTNDIAQGAINAMKEAGIDVTPEQEARLEETTLEGIGAGIGESGPAMIEIGLSMALLELGGGASVGSAIEAMGSTIGRWLGGGENTMGLMKLIGDVAKTEVAFQLGGQDAGTGAGEQIGQEFYDASGIDKLVNKLPLTRKWKQVANTMFKIMSGATAETMQEYTGEFFARLGDGEEWQDALNNTVGDNPFDKLVNMYGISLALGAGTSIQAYKESVKKMERDIMAMKPINERQKKIQDKIRKKHLEDIQKAREAARAGSKSQQELDKAEKAVEELENLKGRFQESEEGQAEIAVPESAFTIDEKLETGDVITPEEKETTLAELETSINNLIERGEEAQAEELMDLHEKLTNYETATETEVSEVTEEATVPSTRVIREKREGGSKQQVTKERFEGKQVDVTDPKTGETKSTTASINKDGSIELTSEDGTKTIVDSPLLEFKESSLDEEGNLTATVTETSTGNTYTIRDNDLALDIAIRAKQNTVGTVPDVVFDKVVEQTSETVRKDETKETTPEETVVEASIKGEQQVTEPSKKIKDEQTRGTTDTSGVKTTKVEAKKETTKKKAEVKKDTTSELEEAEAKLFELKQKSPQKKAFIQALEKKIEQLRAGQPKKIKKQNVSDLDSVETTSEDQKKAINSVKNIVKALGKLVPNQEVIVHTNEDSYAEVVGEADRGSRGALTEDGKIHLNVSKLKSNTALHEATHVVLGAYMKSSPEAVSEFRKQLDKVLPANAKKSLEAFANRYKPDGQAEMDEEFVTEALSRIADGTIELNKSTLEKVKDMLRKLAKKLGLDPNEIKLTGKEDVQDFARKLKEAFDTGKEVDIINNTREVLLESQPYSTGEQGFVKPNAEFKPGIKRQLGDYGKVDFAKKIPTKTLKEVVNEYDGRVFFITSDATGLGYDTNGDPIYGGIGYIAIDKNVNEGIGFASVDNKTALGTMGTMYNRYGGGKPIAVMVMVQAPSSTVGNYYGGKYFGRGLKLIKSKSSADYAKAVESIKKFVEDNKAVSRALEENKTKDKLFDLIENIDNYSEAEFASEFIKDTSFDVRREMLKTLLIDNENVATDKSTPFVKQSLKDLGFNKVSFLEEYGDAELKGLYEGDQAGYLVGGFELTLPETRAELKEMVEATNEKGLEHHQFNGKVPKTGESFYLDGLYNAQDNFEGFAKPNIQITSDPELRNEVDKLVRKTYKNETDYDKKFRKGGEKFVPKSKRGYKHLAAPKKSKFKNEVLPNKFPEGISEVTPSITADVARGMGFSPRPGVESEMSKAEYTPKKRKLQKDDSKERSLNEEFDKILGLEPGTTESLSTAKIEQKIKEFKKAAEEAKKHLEEQETIIEEIGKQLGRPISREEADELKAAGVSPDKSIHERKQELLKEIEELKSGMLEGALFLDPRKFKVWEKTARLMGLHFIETRSNFKDFMKSVPLKVTNALRDLWRYVTSKLKGKPYEPRVGKEALDTHSSQTEYAQSYDRLNEKSGYIKTVDQFLTALADEIAINKIRIDNTKDPYLKQQLEKANSELINDYRKFRSKKFRGENNLEKIKAAGEKKAREARKNARRDAEFETLGTWERVIKAGIVDAQYAQKKLERKLKEAGVDVDATESAYIMNDLQKGKIQYEIDKVMNYVTGERMGLFGTRWGITSAGKKSKQSYKDSLIGKMEAAGVDRKLLGYYMMMTHVKERNARMEAKREKYRADELDRIEVEYNIALETANAELKIIQEELSKVKDNTKRKKELEKKQEKLRDDIEDAEATMEDELEQLDEKAPILKDRAYSGISDAEAQKWLDEQLEENPDRLEKMEEFAEDYRENVLNKTIDIYVKSGLMSKKAGENLKNGIDEETGVKFDHYVPLKVEGDVIEKMFADLGIETRGAKRNADGVKNLKATSKGNLTKAFDKVNPFDQALYDLQFATVKAEQNRTRQNLLEMVRKNPDVKIKNRTTGKKEPLWTIYGEYEKDYKLKPGDPPRVPYGVLKDHRYSDFVLVKENGRTFFIQINDPDLQAAWVSDPSNKSMALKIASGLYNSFGKLSQPFVNFKRQILTTANPSFAIPNLVRDVQDALFNLAGLDEKDLTGKFAKSIPGAMKGFAQYHKGKRDQKWSKLYQEMTEYGGQISWSNLGDVDEMSRQINHRIDKAWYDKVGRASGAKAVLQGIELFNSTMEQGVRLAIYKAVNDNQMKLLKEAMAKSGEYEGIDVNSLSEAEIKEFNPKGFANVKTKAASAAKNVTVNFNRKGHMGSFINSIWMFSNAGFQGTATGMKALKNKPLKLGGGAIAAGIAYNAAIHALLDDDELEKLMSEYDLENNFVIPLIGFDSWIKIPKSYGPFRALINIGGYIYDGAMVSKESGISAGLSEIAWNSAREFHKIMDPVSGSSDNVISSLTPEVLTPIVELGLNKDYRWKDIVPNMYRDPRSGKLKFLQPGQGEYIPDEWKYYENVNALAMQMAYADDIFGADVSPHTYEHLLEGYGYAGVIKDTWELMMNGFGGDLDLGSTPVIKRFYQSPNDEKKIWRKQSKIKEIMKNGKERRLSVKEMRMLYELMDEVGMHPSTKTRNKKLIYDQQLKHK